jgi:hypothetical protein
MTMADSDDDRPVQVPLLDRIVADYREASSPTRPFPAPADVTSGVRAVGAAAKIEPLPHARGLPAARSRHSPVDKKDARAHSLRFDLVALFCSNPRLGGPHFGDRCSAWTASTALRTSSKSH